MPRSRTADIVTVWNPRAWTRNILLSALAAILLAWSCDFSHAEVDDEAGFGPCKPAMRRVRVPRIGGLSYDDARKKVLAAGWKPLMTREPDGSMADAAEGSPDLDGNGRVFWSRGYVEVQNCAGTALARCAFNFVDKNGNRLKVTTAGEEDPKGAFHATVDRAVALCRR